LTPPPTFGYTLATVGNDAISEGLKGAAMNTHVRKTLIAAAVALVVAGIIGGPAAAGEYVSVPGGCVGYVQRDGSNNRAYSYDVYNNCDFIQVRHRFLSQQGGVVGWHFTAWAGSSGSTVYSVTTATYKVGSECELVTDHGVGLESSAC